MEGFSSCHGHLRWLFALLTLSLFASQMLAAAAETPQAAQKPIQVAYIQIQGIHTLTVQEVKRIMITKERRFRWFSKAPFDEKTLNDDLERIEKFYRSAGFYHFRILSHEVVPLAGRDVRIEIKIEEGPPMMVSHLDLLVDGEKSGKWHADIIKVLPLKPGSRFTTAAYEDIEKDIQQFLADWAYPKCKVEAGAKLDKRTNTAEVSIDVTKGSICYVGSIYVEGNETIEKNIILRELTFHSGERFNGSKLKESQRRLFSLDLFQIVDMDVQDMEGDGVVLPVRILVKESKKQTIKVGAGYGTEDHFRGQVQYEVRDFLGDGRKLQISTKASSLEQILEGKLTQPYIFGPNTSLILDAGALHENEVSFENERFFFNPLLKYKFTDAFNTFFGYGVEANRLLSVNLTAGSLGPGDRENQDYFLSYLTGGASWDRVDSLLNPKEGVRILQNVEWASMALGSQVDYVKLTLEGRGYLPIYQFGVLATKLKWGEIETQENTDEIPIFKRFFAGGSDSVRGYPYQRLGPLDSNGYPLGGTTLVEGSAEWRFPIKDPIEGVLFFDFGNVFLESSQFLWNDLGYSIGCGIRYMTLVGPVRLDFGYALNPPEVEHELFSPYQFHFSIGQAF